MPRLLPAILLTALALAGCGSDESENGGSGGSPGGYGPGPATTAQQPAPGATALIACLQKDGLRVEGSGGALKASGNGDVVDIRLFGSAGEADAFAKRNPDSTQAGNRVAVYGSNPKPETVNAVETCLPSS